MDRGQDDPARSISSDPASCQPRATKTTEYSRGSNLPRPSHKDDRSTRERSLYNRGHSEHVVLADCKSPDGVLSSEMAYFTGSPKSDPDDTATVDTSYNTTRQWANARTATLFSDTNTTFTAVLRPDVAQGAWAGTGDNGYGSFVCWEKSLPDLYYDKAVGTECSGVYDCDHEATPILFASTLIFIRHLAVHKGHTGGLYSLFAPKPKPSPPSTPAVGYWGPEVWALNDPERLRKIEYLGPQPGQVYEVTGNCGYEATGDERFPAREIDGVMLPGELPLTTSMPEMAAVGTPVEQFDRGRTRGRDEKGPLDRVESRERGQSGS